MLMYYSEQVLHDLKTQTCVETQKKDFTEVKSSLESCLVIRMGLEPMTPTLKVLCSTS